jgi:hypothetical protein
VVCIVAATVAAAAMALAPGNAVRQSMYAGVRHEPLRSAVMTTLQTVRFGADWMSAGAVVVGALLFIPLGEQWQRRWAPSSARTRPAAVLVMATLAAIIPIAVFPAYWETGTLGQHRTLDAAFFAFLVVAMIGLPLVLPTPAVAALAAFSRDWRRPLAATFVVAVALSRNSYTVGSELAGGRLSAFSRAAAAREGRLAQCRQHGEPLCEVPRFEATPSSFFVLDVSSDADDWVNAAYARYFGVDRVRAATGQDHVRH